MALTQRDVLDFLLQHGGAARNTELLNNFRESIICSDPTEQRRRRDLFKSCVNSVAVVRQIHGVKYVVLRKRFLEAARGDGNAAAEPNRTPLPKRECDAAAAASADVLNNNSCSGTSSDACCIVPGCEGSPAELGLRVSRSEEGDAVPSPGASRPIQQEAVLDAGVLSVTNVARIGKMGAVFAVVAIKSPTSIQSQSEKSQSKKMKTNRQALIHIEPQQLLPSFTMMSKQVFADRTVAVQNGTSRRGCVNGKPEVYGSLRTRRRRSMVSSLPALTNDNRSSEQGLEVKDIAVVPLEPREHEWHVKSAMGHWGQVCTLLLQDAQLAGKRNFISGFTALHWAAKKGSSKMVRKILDVSRQSGAGVHVNVRSHDGYTPLHIAAIHYHEAVLGLLVHDYGADLNVRDNGGKKPYHYLPQSVSSEVRRMLGDPRVSRQPAEHKRNLSDLPKGFNTLSKLFQPSTAQGKTTKRRMSFHFGEDQDENRKDGAFNRRVKEINAP